MRRLAVQTFVTLDGVMQAPGGPEEDTSGGFTHGGWSVGYWDDEVLPKAVDASRDRLGALLLGRRTYEIFARHWPHVTGDPMADMLNSVPKYVASRRLETAAWNNSHVIANGVAEQVERLKCQPGGEIQVHGSAELIQTLIRSDLIDEFRLMIFPVVLGRGKRLFAQGAVPTGLRLTDRAITTTGVVATYERTGTIAYGSFARHEPGRSDMEHATSRGGPARDE